MPLLATNHSFKTCGGPKTFTPTIVFKKCGGKCDSGGQECCILKIYVDFPYQSREVERNMTALCSSIRKPYFSVHVIELLRQTISVFLHHPVCVLHLVIVVVVGNRRPTWCPSMSNATFAYSVASIVRLWKIVSQVLEVVKEQVVRALSTHSSSFEAFRNRVFVLTYSEIVKIMESERRVKEEFESQIQPVV